jgi:outer membrane protein OmpA-like peptidoglycan-associated protein
MRKHYLLILLAFCLHLQTIRSQNSELPNAITAKLNLIDYSSLNKIEGEDEGLRLSQGFEFGLFRNIAPFLNVGVPLKLGLAKLPGIRDNTVTASADLVFHLGNMRSDAKVSPYAFGGAGYYVEDFEFEKTGHLQFPFGAGLNFRVSKYAFINLQGEYRKATEDLRDNIQLGLGFVYLPHKGEPKVAAAPDRDKDGTPDALDRCPDKPGPATALGCPDTDKDGLGDHEDACPFDAGTLETKGCPDMDGDGFADKDDECPTLAGRWNGCPDTDYDGIPDKNDKCPNEAGTAANGGCPDVKDSDGDGVADKLDKCPDVAGTAANGGCPEIADADKDGVADKDDRCPNSAGPASNSGCPEMKPEVKERLKIATKSVQFETAKATLKNYSFAVLDEIVGIMREYPDYTLSISGHTDNVGDAAKNQRLSEARAKTCYDYFIFKGIKSERLRYAGFGEERPLFDNNTSYGREQNRRVEFEMTLE